MVIKRWPKTLLKNSLNKVQNLSKEKKLYDLLLKEKYNSESKGEKFIDVNLLEYNKIDSKKVTKEKYNLIKSIQESFNIDEFLNSPITNYKNISI